MSDRLKVKGKGRLAINDECWHVADLLRQRRLDLGLPQDSLAGQIGVPKSLLWKWENHINTPTLNSLVRWTRALDCKVIIGAMWWDE